MSNKNILQCSVKVMTYSEEIWHGNMKGRSLFLGWSLVSLSPS